MESETLFAIIIAVIAVIFFIFPPRKINSLYGYRTKRSMKNQQNWRFAQIQFGRSFLLSALLFLVITLITEYLHYNIYPVVTVFIPLMALTVFVVEFKLDRKERD